MTTSPVKLFLIAFLILQLSACSSQFGRYQQANDSKPTRLPSQAELKDATPRIEAKSRGGNKAKYTVRGKQYQVLDSAIGFSETGVASWYGEKFHGHLTSNGEIYDMYAMSAAHKNLPLPTYLKVTNLANQKSVVVRVNDRGPFHENRIIDLSYSAAYKIGMLQYGTAQVQIEAITDPIAYQQSLIAVPSVKVTDETGLNPKPINPKPKTIKSSKVTTETIANGSKHSAPTELTYIQVFATQDLTKAKATAEKLMAATKKPVIFPKKQGIYRVKLGPFTSEQNITPVLEQLKQLGYPKAFRRKILQ